MVVAKIFSKTFLPVLLAAVLTSCEQKVKTEELSETGTAPEMTLEQKRAQLQNAAPYSSGSNTGLPPGAVNPPHGQPGHRCEIPVGAPLNGGSGNQPIKTEPLKVSDRTPTKSVSEQQAGKPARNPEHGQPWHRCDIKVGDLLP